ncbi:GTPase Era [Pacificimonas sp. WHA3]|uniref:GTPase Era n=1 Tax=Pacificimonas pallii TaxID=2827236 RepID=A0ABS6SFB7_9SPHN|nr:GTPase Era [Pacificimonas pallii]MBV7256631.1 GTPase Era [Pacificimonas pallii]
MSERHCGVVAVVGAPNAGKSTLVNTLVGQKVAIVSPKVQTTRARLMGVAIDGDTQLILVDTPGIFTPSKRLERAMVHAAWEGASGADLVLLLVDARRGITDDVENILETLAQRKEPKMLALTKVDVAQKQRLLPLAQELNRHIEFAETFMVSAPTGDGVSDLKETLAAAMPQEPWHFPEDQVSNITSRLLAAEITREKLFLQLYQEVPYASTVETESWTDGPNGISIHQTILVERESQKGIVLGKGGSRVKQIGTESRTELEDLFGERVHLFLTVKVKADWADNRESYEQMGLDWTT